MGRPRLAYQFYPPFHAPQGGAANSMYQNIKTQTLNLIAELTANPKPSYNIDGQAVQWSDYLKQLQATVEWCDLQIARCEPGIEEVTVCR